MIVTTTISLIYLSIILNLSIEPPKNILTPNLLNCNLESSNTYSISVQCSNYTSVLYTNSNFINMTISWTNIYLYFYNDSLSGIYQNYIYYDGSVLRIILFSILMSIPFIYYGYILYSKKNLYLLVMLTTSINIIIIFYQEKFTGGYFSNIPSEVFNNDNPPIGYIGTKNPSNGNNLITLPISNGVPNDKNILAGTYISIIILSVILGLLVKKLNVRTSLEPLQLQPYRTTDLPPPYDGIVA